MNILNAIWKFIKGFVMFWKDFLVGDSPELALGVLFILGIAFLLRDLVVLSVISIIVLVLLLATVSIWRKTHSHS